MKTMFNRMWCRSSHAMLTLPLLLLAIMAGCNSGDSPTATTSSTASSVSMVIGVAGGTITHPNGVQVVIPAGALSADTTIGIARNSAGAPAKFANGQPADPIYEFTPHDLMFNKPVLFRMRVPAGTTTAAPLIASFGQGWEASDAVIANGFAEWERNTFSWASLNTPCVNWGNDPHPCARSSGKAFVTATPSNSITQLTGVGLPSGLSGLGTAGFYAVDTAALTQLHLTVLYRGAPDCSNGRALVKKLIRGAGGAGGPAQLVTPPGEVTAPLDANARGAVTFTIPWDPNTTATTAYVVQFSCDRPDYNPGGGYTTGGFDWMTFIPSSPVVPGFSYGGTIAGLTGSGLELQNGPREVLSVPAGSTTFTFLTPLADGAHFNVGIRTQPAGQHCTVAPATASGTISGGPVSNIQVTCTGVTIGGTVNGLTGVGLVLQRNGGNDLAITANGVFTFTNPVAVGASYTVTVQTQPTGQTCTVTNGSGTANTAVTNVTVTCVGSGPAPLLATSIATGFWSSLVAATDGTVWAWGQFVDPVTGGFKASAPFATTPVQVQGLSGVTAVAMTSELPSFYALHNDGTVSAWGNNSSGQLGDRTTTTRTTHAKVLNGVATPIDEVCSISAGAHFLVMARDESCSPSTSGISSGPWIVGLFSGTAIGGDTSTPSPLNGAIAKAVPGLPTGVAVSQMSACSAANCGGAVFFRLANGNSFVWGNNAFSTNKLGAGTSTAFAGGAGGPLNASFFWAGASNVRLGQTFAIASTGTGTLEAVGGNLNGELGNGAANSSTQLTPVSVLTNVTAISAGQVNAAAVTNGELWVWGTLGNTVYNFTTPTRLGTGTGFTQVSVGDAHGLAIGSGGQVFSWGEASFGALGRSGSGGTPAAVFKP